MHMIKVNNFVNNLTEATAIVVLGTAIAKISTKMDKRGKADLSHLRFDSYDLFLLSVYMGFPAVLVYYRLLLDCFTHIKVMYHST